MFNPVLDSPTKVIYAALYLDDEADYWYQTIQAEYPNLNWQNFVLQLLRQFSTAGFKPALDNNANKLYKNPNHGLSFSSQGLELEPSKTSGPATNRAPFIRKISPAEWAKRREKGQYYNCDDVFISGHKCARPQLYLMVGEEESDSQGEYILELPEPKLETTIEPDCGVSIHANRGTQGLRTLNAATAVESHPNHKDNENPTSLPPSRKEDHLISILEGSKPVNLNPYKNPFLQRVEIECMVKEMLDGGIIRHNQSPYVSPVLLVKKWDNTWRFLVYYCVLNAITVKNRFPIPLIEEMLDELYGSTIFSKLDLRSGYHQIRVNEQDIHKTAFKTQLGHYEFVVMPFGLINAPTTFQGVMNEIFRDYIDKFTLRFTIRTDQEALKHLISQKITTLIQQKWLTKLLGFDYVIEYKGGRDNIVVDPLSRLHEAMTPEESTELQAITVVLPKWKIDLQNSWE
ncbi:hypothetical protein AgCh_034436 [Apium graveolens]